MKKMFICITLAIAAIATVSVLLQQRKNTVDKSWFKVIPSADYAVVDQMEGLENKGDFDGAIALATASLKGDRSDDVLLQNIAMAYFIRAQADSAKRERWTAKALTYSKQAFETNRTDIINTYNLGESYLTAAMNRMSSNKTEACDDLKQSLALFESLRNDPFLREDWGVVEGERVVMRPYRAKLDQERNNVVRHLAVCAAH